jgi:hypothetical protein
MMPEKIKRDRPVHRTAVDIDIVQLPRQLLGQRALPAGRPTVYRNNDFLHKKSRTKGAAFFYSIEI